MPVLLETEPQLNEQDVFTCANQSMSIAGTELLLYTLPENSKQQAGSPDMIGFDNPEGFTRVMENGLSALEDGESVNISPALTWDSDGTSSTRLFTIRRNGGKFSIVRTEDFGQHPHVSRDSESSEDIVIHNGLKQVVGLFDQEAFLHVGQRGIGLADMSGKLGEVVKDMGFTSEEHAAEMPLPETLQQNISRIREQGIQIPEVKFFNDGAIDGQEYVESWAEGKFPASEHPGYFAHDLLSEHFRPLVILREDAMGVATLYARAVLEQETVVAELPKDEYQINAEHPEMVEVEVSGREKIDHAAICLDNFTTELSLFADEVGAEISDERIQYSFSEHPSHGWRYTPQMVKVILKSTYRDEFLARLKSVDSKAFDDMTETFDYETYAREIFVRAQSFWGIQVATKEEATQELDDELLF